MVSVGLYNSVLVVVIRLVIRDFLVIVIFFVVWCVFCVFVGKLLNSIIVNVNDVVIGEILKS